MELPFKYIVLCIIRTLHDRNMPLTIKKVNLKSYISKFMKKSYFTIEEKKEIYDNFDFNYELSDLLENYIQYFDDNGEEILFDIDYIDEINNLIMEETEQYDEELICDVDATIEGDTEFFDILEIPIKKDFYNYMADLEKKIEDCYNEMFGLEGPNGIETEYKIPLEKKIKKLKMTKIIMLHNMKTFFTFFERHDLMQYASNISSKMDDLSDINLLIEDDIFDATDITDDVFMRSIFLGEDSYRANLTETLILDVLGILPNKKNSYIKFYITFINLLDEEINHSNPYLQIELIRIKYRLKNVLDSIYDTALFLNKEYNYEHDFKEDYRFAKKGVNYFVRELLMYDDEYYRYEENGEEKLMSYLDNIMKKIYIETYYKLTNDEEVIKLIKENELYGVNAISSGLLKNIVEKPKTKVKEV